MRAKRARRSCPAGFVAEVGHTWCGPRGRMNRTEDLHVNGREEPIDCTGGVCARCKALIPDLCQAQE